MSNIEGLFVVGEANFADQGPYREAILAKFDQGLSAQRIWQDLMVEHGFSAGYDSVKRFVDRPSNPLRRSAGAV